MPSAHPSDSESQRAAETLLCAQLGRKVEISLRRERIALGDGHCVELDAFNREHLFVAEIFARIGVLKAAQRRKVGTDILKLLAVEKALGGSWRKALCFVDDAAAQEVRGKSWLAYVVKAERIEVFVLPVSADARASILASQEKQYMTNLSRDDG